MVSRVSGVGLAQRLNADLPEAKCLLFTLHNDIGTVKSAIAAGVRGYVLKDDGHQVLATAVNRLGRGLSYFSSPVLDLIADLAEKGAPSVRTDFTPRELAIISLVADGYTIEEIAKRLDIKPTTAESNRTSVMRRAGARTAA